MRLWLNGALLAPGHARIDPADRGFTLGDGVFETIRVRDGAPVWLDRHLARLRDGARVLGIDLAWTDVDLEGGARAVIAAGDAPDCVLRITLSRGPGARGLAPAAAAAGQPTLLIAPAPLPPPSAPARVILCGVTRRNEHSPLARIKSLNYLDNILARVEASARGADDAVLLNTAGRVAEACAANLFVRLDGVWCTPPCEEGALPGIARAALIHAGNTRELPVSLADLRAASAALLTNSLSLRPVAALEGRPLDVRAAQALADLAAFG